MCAKDDPASLAQPGTDLLKDGTAFSAQDGDAPLPSCETVFHVILICGHKALMHVCHKVAKLSLEVPFTSQ